MKSQEDFIQHATIVLSSTPNGTGRVHQTVVDIDYRDAKVVDLSKCLFGWDVKKGKRGRLGSSVDVVKVNKVPNEKYYFGLGTYDSGEVDEDMQEAAKILVLMAHDHQLKAKTSAQVEELMATSMTERNLHVKESTNTINGEIKGVCDFDLNKLPTFEDVI
ncbi:hypothetical protein Tco_0968559 [Tanacetum coccineum]